MNRENTTETLARLQAENHNRRMEEFSRMRKCEAHGRALGFACQLVGEFAGYIFMREIARAFADADEKRQKTPNNQVERQP